MLSSEQIQRIRQILGYIGCVIIGNAILSGLRWKCSKINVSDFELFSFSMLFQQYSFNGRSSPLSVS